CRRRKPCSRSSSLLRQFLGRLSLTNSCDGFVSVETACRSVTRACGDGRDIQTTFSNGSDGFLTPFWRSDFTVTIPGAFWLSSRPSECIGCLPMPPAFHRSKSICLPIEATHSATTRCERMYSSQARQGGPTRG